MLPAKEFAENIGLPNMPLTDAYNLRKVVMGYVIEELQIGGSRWSSEHDGILHLGIDNREDIKSQYIKPFMPDYDKFRTEYEKDLEPHPNDADQKFLETFFEKAEWIMCAVERYIRDEIVDFLEEARHTL